MGARRSAAGWRCCRSSASCAATSPAPAGRTTSPAVRSAGTACLQALRNRSACRRRRRDAHALRRGVRAADRNAVQRVRARPRERARVRATVLVRPKAGILDPQGQAVENSLRHLGFAVGEARVGRLVELELETEDRAEAQLQLERMCEQLLANPLIESYEIELRTDS